MTPHRPHPLARSPLVDRINGWLDAAWDKGRLDRPPLDPETLWQRGSKGFAEADEFTGRNQEDAADFRLRLEKLCDAVREEARLNPLGQCMAYGQLVRAIRHRLELGRLWGKQPELLATKIAAPILVVGQMRSGTTRIHRLLAADPAHSATRFCDSWHPVPSRLDMRPLWSGAQLFFARKVDPWIDALHPFGAARVDEELGWLAAALDHCAYEAQWYIPSYVAWSEARDPAPVYREFARILRTDAAHRGNADRPRVMKVPQFSEDLAMLLATFPDARVVLAERDDEATIASSASLVANQMTIQSDDVDLDWIESEWQRKIALRHERCEAALSRFSGPVAWADFDALGEDPDGEIARIYAALDLPLTEQARAAMADEAKRAEKGAHKQHREQLKNFARA